MLLRHLLTGLALAALVLTAGCATTCGNKHGGCCGGSVSSAPPCCGGAGGPPPGAIVGP
jgi:hypothetical protein